MESRRFSTGKIPLSSNPCPDQKCRSGKSSSLLQSIPPIALKDHRKEHRRDQSIKQHDKRDLPEHHAPDLIDVRLSCTVQYIHELIRRQLEKGTKRQCPSDKWRHAEQDKRNAHCDIRRMGLR